jgi:hypothetical protein
MKFLLSSRQLRINNFYLENKMKKVLALISLLVYAFSVSSLVHASTMNIFPGQEMSSMHSCHEAHTSTPDPIQKISCCEFISSNQYSQHTIQLIHTVSSLATTNTIPPIKMEVKDTNHYTPHIASSPGGPPLQWYQNFSDLVGIIVDLA